VKFTTRNSYNPNEKLIRVTIFYTDETEAIKSIFTDTGMKIDTKYAKKRLGFKVTLDDFSNFKRRVLNQNINWTITRPQLTTGATSGAITINGTWKASSGDASEPSSLLDVLSTALESIFLSIGSNEAYTELMRIIKSRKDADTTAPAHHTVAAAAAAPAAPL